MARIIDTALLTPTTILDRFTNDSVYNGLDCAVTLEILHVLHSQLDAVSRRTYEFSLALQGPVLDMAMRGVLVDKNKRVQAHNLIQQVIARIEAQLDRIINEGIGVQLNWRSSKQLQSLFYDILGLKPIRKRNTKGQLVPTVDRDAIEKLSNYFIAEPLCNHLILLRELDKKRQFLETELDSDGCMHTNFNIAGTNTGRLASALDDYGLGGNMQNIDRELRSVFIARPGRKFLNIDLEQGDSRNVGAVLWNLFVESHGEAFAGAYLDACESGDLHVAVAKMVWPEFPWNGERVRDRQIADQLFYRQDSYRQTSKKLGHATNFFGQPPHVAKQTKTDKNNVELFQQRYFTAFPAIGCYDKKDTKAVNWHNHVRLQLTQFQHITTLMGRRRFFFGHPKDEETLRGAIAYEPQSLTADEVDTGLLRIWRQHRIDPLLQVHDSVLFEFDEDREEELVPWAIAEMPVFMNLRKGRKFSVPVEGKTGWNWGDYADDNPDGLTKWKGHDSRKRSEKAEPLSLRRLLSAG